MRRFDQGFFKTGWAGAALGLLVLVLSSVGLARAGAPPKDSQPPFTNRLAHETSPYLLMHAHNPVDWYPWGNEAFAKAKKEGKLVFLSIGYSSCYWCHVMERESFANPDVAKLLNQYFVCIKVDREERPDIDTIYMTALNVQGSRGGWPLSMFLTADGKPIVGGTYWPPEDREVEKQTVHGFKSLLKIVHKFQTDDPEKLTKRADEMAAATADALVQTQRGIALVGLNRDLVAGAVDSVKEEFDTTYGGFGTPSRGFRGPKFPVPPYLALLLHEAARGKPGELSHVIGLTLDRMARGGIYDQLGGGFHRYSTERTWTVPHFEKMLYDNAQLAEVYARAYQQTKNPLYRRVVDEALAFVLREMTGPEGGFFSALDAETHGEEGRFYVWTDKELDDALGDGPDVARFKRVYGVEAGPNFEKKYHILVLAKPLADVAGELKLTEEALVARLAPLREKLFEARARRPRPFLDTKVLTAWNGQMIAGFAVAGQVFDKPRYREAAARAAQFVLSHLRTKEGRLLRTYTARPGQPAEGKLNAYLDDYAFLVHGLLCLHDATGEAGWLNEAKALTDTMVRWHADKDRGGFFYTSNDHEKLFARSKDQYDSAQPSGNSVAAQNLVRLWVKTGDEAYRALAEKSFKSLAGALKANPSSLTAMAHGLALFLDAQEARGAAPPGRAEPAAQQQGTARKSDKLVKITAAARPEKPGSDGVQTVTVTLAIDKDWHLGANPAGETGVPTTVTVTAKAKPESVKIDYPAGKLVKDPIGDYRIYEGTVAIKAVVRRAAGDTSPLELSVKFAACSDKDMTCLPPATVKVAVP
jgi:uncharacterized protein YyaL (SSP411 family)